MPQIFINGTPVQADASQTVLQAALANGFFIPYFCWHPQLSIAGNCRMCTIQIEGRSWVEIACNTPVSEGLRVLTDSDLVRENRKATMQFITLNHPVDCGICDKSGECTLQDYHFKYNGSPSISTEPKVRLTKFYDLGRRIVLDNERCILCSRCVRFTHEISKSKALGILDRGDVSVVRPSSEHALDADPYSDNVIDICPVGALLSRDFLYKSRVWYLKPTPSVCPGCSRGCTVNLWHRKPEWRLNALDPKQNTSIARVTPLENPRVNGPWICNKGRDLAKIFERPRAVQPMLKGRAADIDIVVGEARALLKAARHPVALVSSWGSNEELDAFQRHLGTSFTTFVKQDAQPVPGEVVQDEILIQADKNPNTTRARELFGTAQTVFPAGTDLVLVWGEGFDFNLLPRGAAVIFLASYLLPENGFADAFLPVSIQTERDGGYTNFQGVVGTFKACFPKAAGVSDAETIFAALAGAREGRP
ncbi:MAG: 2Fe-2S iron-sulfur cluster-binding protein [Kiritimatiellia bacterium]